MGVGEKWNLASDSNGPLGDAVLRDGIVAEVVSPKESPNRKTDPLPRVRAVTASRVACPASHQAARPLHRRHRPRLDLHGLRGLVDGKRRGS